MTRLYFLVGWVRFVRDILFPINPDISTSIGVSRSTPANYDVMMVENIN